MITINSHKHERYATTILCQYVIWTVSLVAMIKDAPLPLVCIVWRQS